MQQPPNFIVARESVEITLEAQHSENPQECAECDRWASSFRSKKCHPRDARALTGDVNRELSAQSCEPQPLSERGEDALLAGVEGGLFGWHIS